MNQYYWPEAAAAGQFWQDLAEDLVAAGHRATVLTGRTAYAGTRILNRAELYNGVRILRCGLPGSRKSSLVRRLLEFSWRSATRTRRP